MPKIVARVAICRRNIWVGNRFAGQAGEQAENREDQPHQNMPTTKVRFVLGPRQLLHELLSMELGNLARNFYAMSGSLRERVEASDIRLIFLTPDREKSAGFRTGKNQEIFALGKINDAAAAADDGGGDRYGPDALRRRVGESGDSCGRCVTGGGVAWQPPCGLLATERRARGAEPTGALVGPARYGMQRGVLRDAAPSWWHATGAGRDAGDVIPSPDRGRPAGGWKPRSACSPAVSRRSAVPWTGRLQSPAWCYAHRASLRGCDAFPRARIHRLGSRRTFPGGDRGGRVREWLFQACRGVPRPAGFGFSLQTVRRRDRLFPRPNDSRELEATSRSGGAYSGAQLAGGRGTGVLARVTISGFHSWGDARATAGGFSHENLGGFATR